MIISASRRTDIPAFYVDWFFNRLSEGFVYVRNPMNPHQVSSVSLDRSVVDCIVFWTKNPKRILSKLYKLANYSFYFQFTLNPYGQRLEPNLPQISELLSTFISLSKILGRNRIIWRYDPIILTDEYNFKFHIQAFSDLAKVLSPFTRRCVISFVDLYRKSEKNLFGLKPIELDKNQMLQIASSFASIAKHYDLEIVSCAEKIDLQRYGIPHGRCIDEKLIYEISKYSLNVGKDKTQRPECGCVGSIDIGAYNTCPHGCLYCYANFDSEVVKNNFSLHDPNSPLLFGKVESSDRISVRKVVSCKILQRKLL
jgi:DNA repair photolyase